MRRLDPTRPTVPEVAPMVSALYRRHGAGCCWHIVLDDGNVSDGNVAWCAEIARQEGHPDCLALVDPLLRMSRTQRLKLYGMSKV